MEQGNSPQSNVNLKGHCPKCPYISKSGNLSRHIRDYHPESKFVSTARGGRPIKKKRGRRPKQALRPKCKKDFDEINSSGKKLAQQIPINFQAECNPEVPRTIA